MSKDNHLSPKRSRFYLAYGSNLSLKQMAYRCPTAEVFGRTTLPGWRLWFRGEGSAVATIEPEDGATVPVLIWSIEPQDEQALDVYEGWPYLYRKKVLRVKVNGRWVSAMAYLMNTEGRPYGTPSRVYLDTILEGYQNVGFDESILWQAALSSHAKAKEEASHSSK